jgi:hypothetical protein
MIRKVAICASLFCMARAAFGSDWEVVHADATEAISVDTDSIVRTGPRAKVWVREVFAIPQQVPNTPRPAKTVKSVWTFDCTQKTVTSGDAVVLDEAGAYITGVPAGPEHFDDISPDSTGEAIMQQVCQIEQP